jgi:hypothetical protein
LDGCRKKYIKKERNNGEQEKYKKKVREKGRNYTRNSTTMEKERTGIRTRKKKEGGWKESRNGQRKKIKK